MILGLCGRFKCLPSQVLEEDATLLRLLRVEALGRQDRGEEVDADGW